MKYNIEKSLALLVGIMSFITGFFVAVPMNVCASPDTLYVGGSGPGNYTTIQAAINAANPGDTIYVYARTYYEHIIVDKSLNLVGENKNDTIVDGSGSGSCFLITADGVGIEGFTIQNGGDHGINLWFSDNNVIEENFITLNKYGIRLAFSDNNIIRNNTILKNKGGIWPAGSHSNTISNNIIMSKAWGIILYWYCNRNIISDNTISSDYCAYYESHSHDNTISNNRILDSDFGVYLLDDRNDILTNNTINCRIYNFMVNGVEPSEFIHDIDSSNTVDGKPIYYVVNQQDMQIPADAGFVGVIKSRNITVRDLTLSKNSHGVLFALTTNSRIENVTALNNFNGIQLSCSDNNIINRNTLSNNGDGIWLIASGDNTINDNIVSRNGCGISLWAGSRNLIKDNSIINNGEAIILYYSDKNIVSRNIMSNNWDGVWLCKCSSNVICENVISYNNVGICLVSYVYNNAIYHNNIINNRKQTELRWYDNNRWDDGYPSGGNYWSDYSGADHYSGPNQNISGSDGIGDTPYIVGGNIRDTYPLMYPWGKPRISVEKEFIPSEIMTTSQGVMSSINITNIGDVNITSMVIMDEYVENMRPNDPAELLVTITSDEGEIYAVMPEDLDITSTENNITISFELPLEVVPVFWENGTLHFGEELYYLESIPKDWVVGVQYLMHPVTELEMGTYYANATITAYSETGKSTTETATGMLTASLPIELAFPTN